MPANVFQQYRGGCLRLSHAGHVWRYQYARVVPKRMGFGERLGIDDIEDGPRQLSRIERSQKCLAVQVTTPPDIDDGGATRQARKNASIENASRSAGQR
jgi:hypothetical protein